MNKPTISVLIPNYNQGRFFAAALGSILKQTLSPTEIVVVDDKSTDDSVKIIDTELKSKQAVLVEKEISVKFIKRETNGGLATCRNTGLQEITSEFVALLDCDDFYYPDKIKKSIEVLERFLTEANVGLQIRNRARKLA